MIHIFNKLRFKTKTINFMTKIFALNIVYSLGMSLGVQFSFEKLLFSISHIRRLKSKIFYTMS